MILSSHVSDEKIFLFFSLLGNSIPNLVRLSGRRRAHVTVWVKKQVVRTPGYPILTLPAIHGRGFFLHPARLLVFRGERRVEAVCPEALPGEPDVSLCPRVHAKAFARMFNAAL